MVVIHKTVVYVTLFIISLIFAGVIYANLEKKASENHFKKQLQPFHVSAFNEQQLQNHWTLLFFGYTHCTDVCPRTLTQLNTIYNALISNYPNLQVIFISIDPAHEHARLVKSYAKSFNKH